MFQTPLDSIFYTFMMSLGEYKSIYEYFGSALYLNLAKVKFNKII